MVAELVVRAPGKVFLTGEYGVLWGAPACVAAVEPGVTALRRTTSSGQLRLIVPGGDVRGSWHEGSVRWERESAASRFAARALSLALAAGWSGGSAPAGLELRFAPSPTGKRRKLGLGTSAAACAVASLAGLLGEGSEEPDLAEVFRIAARAHWEVQGRRGSNGDVAASVYGGVIRYERYPLERDEALPSPSVERAASGQLRLGLVYSGQPSQTPSMVAAIEGALSVAERQAYARDSAIHTEAFAAALGRGDERAALSALDAAGDAVAELGKRARVEVMTEALAAIQALGRRAGVAAKVSGAGGGDGALFAAFDPAHLEAALAEAAQAGYTTLDLPIAPGVSAARRSP